LLDENTPTTRTQNNITQREREKLAFQQMHPHLLEKYAGQYVAIYEGKLVDHDIDKQALFQRIDTAFPDVFVLIRPVLVTPEIVYQSRSHRLVQ
jgi:hypothetical protein